MNSRPVQALNGRAVAAGIFVAATDGDVVSGYGRVDGYQYDYDDGQASLWSADTGGGSISTTVPNTAGALGVAGVASHPSAVFTSGESIDDVTKVQDTAATDVTNLVAGPSLNAELDEIGPSGIGPLGVDLDEIGPSGVDLLPDSSAADTGVVDPAAAPTAEDRTGAVGASAAMESMGAMESMEAMSGTYLGGELGAEGMEGFVGAEADGEEGMAGKTQGESAGKDVSKGDIESFKAGTDPQVFLREEQAALDAYNFGVGGGDPALLNSTTHVNVVQRGTSSTATAKVAEEGQRVAVETISALVGVSAAMLLVLSAVLAAVLIRSHKLRPNQARDTADIELGSGDTLGTEKASTSIGDDSAVWNSSGTFSPSVVAPLAQQPRQPHRAYTASYSTKTLKQGKQTNLKVGAVIADSAFTEVRAYERHLSVLSLSPPILNSRGANKSNVASGSKTAGTGSDGHSRGSSEHSSSTPVSYFDGIFATENTSPVALGSVDTRWQAAAVAAAAAAAADTAISPHPEWNGEARIRDAALQGLMPGSVTSL
jgi:hypothetical protein